MMSVVTARSGTPARAARQPLEVALGRVAPVHGGEHPVAPGLQRQVEVLAHRRGLGHRLDHVGAEVLRVRAGEAHPLDAVDRTDRPQEVGEERPHPHLLARPPPGQGEVAPVGVHVLAEQRDLGDALAGQHPHLVDQPVEGLADLGAAHGGTMQKAQELSQPIWIVTQAA